MTQVAIDFSITSTAICIDRDGEISWISINGGGYAKSKIASLERLGIKVVMFKRLIKETDYSANETIKTKEAMLLAELIVDNLPIDDDIEISIEGFSYNSRSSSALDLVLYQSILREKIVDTYGAERLVIKAPTQVKKRFTNKGNAKKEVMIDKFRSSSDYNLQKTKFWNYLVYFAPKKYDKPIDDLVDSYAVLQC